MRRAPAAVLVALVALGACDPGAVSLVQPTGRGNSESSIAEVVVTRPGGEPAAGALVHYLRVEPFNYRWQEARADDSGQLRLELQPGWLYWIAAEREDPTLGTLGGGAKLWAAKGDSVEVPVSLSPPRREGVVISEVYMYAPPVWETGNQPYQVSKYIELANNSDQTVYVDGMLIGKAYLYWRNSAQYGHHRCADTEPMRNDSAGVWSDATWRFPGSGSEHPLAPGEAALIAVVAADHRQIHPSTLDLSHARFELGLPGYADNPSAANLTFLGPNPPNQVEQSLGGAFPYWFVAAPADVEALPLAQDPGAANGRHHPHRRIPREILHDVAYLLWDSTGAYHQHVPSPPCTDPVHPSFDAIPGGFQKSTDLYRSMQRRSVSVNGRTLLLDTNTSWIDFMLADRTPGTLP